MPACQNMKVRSMDVDSSTNHSPEMAVFKLALAWLGYAVGSITMQGLVLTLTAIYTALQIYLLVRDKIINTRKDGS